MEIKELKANEVEAALFAGFDRFQEVTKCWRKIKGQWIIKDIAFIEQWGEEDIATLVQCLRHTLSAGGVIFGGFEDGILKAFASVENGFFGKNDKYMDLSSIHVSSDRRGTGAGKKLFFMAADWARKKGADKLYISAHSSVESQAFYKAMGCVEAKEYDKRHTEAEPCDCQLEYALKPNGCA